MGFNWTRAQPNAKAAGIMLARKFHIATVYCYADRPNTANPSQPSDHAFGAADDFMGAGWDLAYYAQSHARALQITYIIHDRKIWSVARSGEGWRAYTGPNPHTDHVHISFVRTSLPAGPMPSGSGAQATPAVSASNAGLLPNLPGPVDEIVNALTSASFWLRVLMFVAGLLLVLLATGSLALAQLITRKVTP